MEGKVYYLSVDKWNLMESLVTESISPYSFYWKRDFSNSLSRIKDEGNKKLSQLLLCSLKKGEECLIQIHESLLDKTSLTGVLKRDKKSFYRDYFSYNKTIYFKKGLVKFLFKNKEVLNEVIAQSRIVFELKCVDKYKDSFVVDEQIGSFPKNWKPFDSVDSTFEESTFITFDNKYNLIKSAIIGYARGLLTSSDSNEQKLKSQVINLKNEFTGLHTDIMVNNVGITNPKKYEDGIKTCKDIYNSLRNENTNYFDILVQIFAQLKMLVNKRSLKIMTMSDDDYMENLYAKKDDLLDEINTIELENNINGIRFQLEEIKAQEVKNGQALGKPRLYYKKGTPERERKDYLKGIIKDFEEHNSRYADLLKQLEHINDSIVSKETNSTEYDNTITAVFNRISDIMNDLIKKVNDSQTLSAVNFSDLIIRDDSLSLVDKGNVEIMYFNIALDYILKSNFIKPISDSTIIDIITVTGQNFSRLEASKTETGRIILSTLRDFWKYKNNKTQNFTLPNDLPIFNSIMSFYVKPFGFDQIERYMLNRNYTQKQFAFTLWGACKGFSDLPKTFTDVLYNSDTSDKVDQFLFDNYLSRSLTYK